MGELMTAAEAAWVRANAWRPFLRRAEAMWPGSAGRCQCQRETCHQCDNGRCSTCTGVPRRHTETTVWKADGLPATFPEPYRHRTIDGPPKRTPVAQVWLADRVCVSECRHGCRGQRAMSPAEASWVRANAWTAAMRREWADYPDRHGKCACQFGPSIRCEHGECSKCHATGLPFPEAYITTGDCYVLNFREPYEHPTTSATGQHPTRTAQVWLADRVCRWRCPCSCGHKPKRAPLPPPKARAMTWLGEPVEQEALF